jgi:hypothetical protein
MSSVSAYRVRVNTGSSDEEALLLFVDRRLTACLVRLDDRCHGELRGKWFVESAFGFDPDGLKEHASIKDAVSAITERATGRVLRLEDEPGELP